MHAHPLQAGVAMTALLAGLVVLGMTLGLRKQGLMLRKRLAQVYAEKASAARLQHNQDLALHYSAMALHTWPAQYVMPSSVPYTVLAEGRGRGRHLWSQALSALSTCVAFGPDGRTVAVAGKQGEVELWDVQRGLLTRTLVPRDSRGRPVLALGFARSGRLAATGEDGAVRVWEPDGRELPAMSGHTRPVRSLAISPDGEMIATASDDDTVRLWGLDGLKPPVARLPVQTMGAGSLALDRGVEKLFLTARDGSLSMLDVGVRNAAEFPPEVVSKRLIGHIKPVEVDGGLRHVTYIPDGPNGQRLVAFSAADPDECAIVQLWDLSYWRDAGRLHHDRRVTATCFAEVPRGPHGELMQSPSLCTASENGVIRVWDILKRTVKVELTGHDGAVLALAVSPDGRLLASVGEDRSLRLWDIETGWRRHGIPRPRRAPAELAFSADREQLVEVQRADGRVTAFDTMTRRPVGDDAVRLGAVTGPLAMSPDGHRVALRQEGRVTLHDLRVTNGRAHLVSAGSAPLTSAARALSFTLGGRPLVVERSDAGFAVRDLAGGPVLSELIWNGSEPTALAVGPGATRVLLLDAQRGAHLWEPALTGRTPQPLREMRDVTAVAISPGGDGLALGDVHGRVMFWERGRRRQVELDAHHVPVRTLAFSADGLALASTGEEPVIRTWDLTAFSDPAELLAQLRLTSPYEYDAGEMALVPRETFQARPWFPVDYRLPQEAKR